MLKNKANNKKGFTLAELLIVVAIIGILVAISFPIFTSQLEKSREATDLANERSAKSAASVLVLDEKTEHGTFYYDAANGKLVSEGNKSNIKGYGKSNDNKDLIIKVTIHETTGKIETDWVSSSSSSPTESSSSEEAE